MKDFVFPLLREAIRLAISLAWSHWREKRAIQRYQRLPQSRTASLASGANTPSINHRQ